jgi:hypothetical protein
MRTRSRAFVAALQISLDGYVQGADGEIDWVDSWDDALGLIPDADAAVLGGGMYPGYEQLWGRSRLIRTAAPRCWDAG